jgi:hypothetical protein
VVTQEIFWIKGYSAELCYNIYHKKEKDKKRGNVMEEAAESLSIQENDAGISFHTDHFPYLVFLNKLVQKQSISPPDRKPSKLDPPHIVDIETVLAPFGDRADEVIENMSVLALDNGCEGKCPFCFYGVNKGITHTFSFASVCRFIQRYDALLTKNNTNAFSYPLTFYGNSDPFSYEDGDKSYVDVYKKVEDMRHKQSRNYVSTALPPGSEKHFITFMEYIAEKHKIDPSQEMSLSIRLSVSQYNCVRVEETMRKLTIYLLNKGYSETEINTLYNKYLRIGERYKPCDEPSSQEGVILNPLEIKTDSDLQQGQRHLNSVSDLEGNVITPNGVVVEISVAKTRYNPYGVITKDVSTITDCITATPLGLFKPYFSRNFDTDHLLIPPTRRLNDEAYTLEVPQEDIMMQLGRDIEAYATLLNNFSSFFDSPYIKEEEIGVKKDWYDAQKRKYMHAVMQEYSIRRVQTQKQHDRALQYVAGNTGKEGTTKIEYYRQYAERWIAIMDSFAHVIAEGATIDQVALYARGYYDFSENEIMAWDGTVQPKKSDEE